MSTKLSKTLRNLKKNLSENDFQLYLANRTVINTLDKMASTKRIIDTKHGNSVSRITRRSSKKLQTPFQNAEMP